MLNTHLEHTYKDAVLELPLSIENRTLIIENLFAHTA